MDGAAGAVSYLPEPERRMEASVGSFVCGLKDGQGHVCGRTFESKQQLVMHQIKMKGGERG
eukprot:13558321-Alexandrium_andersonii.AAC.1